MSLLFRQLAVPGIFQALAAALLLCLIPLSAVGSEPASAVRPLNILVLGDSLAAGYGLDPEEAFPALLQEKITRADLSAHVINAGLSGDTSAGGMRRIQWLLRQPVEILILELGANDGLRGIDPETTQSNLQTIIDRTREKNPGVRILVAGMQMPSNFGVDYTERFRAIFPTLARENNAALIPFLLEGVGGQPELNLADRIHPNVEGQKVLAENVWKVLEPVLREKRSGSAAAR